MNGRGPARTQTGQAPVLELTRELIARRSQTPQDAGCQEILSARLRPLGFRCDTLVSNGVANLWARRGDTSPVVCFAGHSDVVPAGPLGEWRSDPFVPTLRDGYLYGRGAADMKASLAAFVVAVESFIASVPAHAGSIALLITSDEEGPATDGTVKVVDKLRTAGQSIDYCVVGEPTSVERLGDMIKNGRRGSLSGRLTIRGIQGHIAYPHLAKNPIHLAAPAVAELAATRWDDGNEYFPPTTWQASNVRAGTGALNVIPGNLELDFNFRYATASTPQSLRQRLEAVLAQHGLDYAIEWTEPSRPYLTPRGRLVETVGGVIRQVCAIQPELSCTGGTSDGRFIADICREVVELGPVNESIHKVNERIAVDDLEPLARLYRGILDRLLQA
ncbi:MAG TPA: succinyl-diaminopimelate desuccinylase [Casimicrobiaceae bacterium]|nr:succinyl-diaminopimelate desuccinylase [Casimicrobiaceae bacterium]